MSENDDRWFKQLLESIKKASRLHQRLKKAIASNSGDLNKAWEIYEAYCQAYNLNGMSFEEFVKFGESAFEADSPKKTEGHDDD